MKTKLANYIKDYKNLTGCYIGKFFEFFGGFSLFIFILIGIYDQPFQDVGDDDQGDDAHLR